jgi:DNA-binding HxlR family transcriptional regulator
VRRTDTAEWPCNIARAANVLADHWNVLLLRQACFGTRRFEAFQRTLGIGRNMLTLRLQGLVDEGLLDRVEYQSAPVRREYRLTDKGRDASSVLAAMAAGGERRLTGPEAPARSGGTSGDQKCHPNAISRPEVPPERPEGRGQSSSSTVWGAVRSTPASCS